MGYGDEDKGPAAAAKFWCRVGKETGHRTGVGLDTGSTRAAKEIVSCSISRLFTAIRSNLTAIYRPGPALATCSYAA